MNFSRYQDTAMIPSDNSPIPQGNAIISSALLDSFLPLWDSSWRGILHHLVKSCPTRQHFGVNICLEMPQHYVASAIHLGFFLFILLVKIFMTKWNLLATINKNNVKFLSVMNYYRLLLRYKGLFFHLFHFSFTHRIFYTLLVYFVA